MALLAYHILLHHIGGFPGATETHDFASFVVINSLEGKDSILHCIGVWTPGIVFTSHISRRGSYGQGKGLGHGYRKEMVIWFALLVQAGPEPISLNNEIR